MKINEIFNEDCLETMANIPNDSIDCVVTSPPYWALRDYGVAGQLGLEKTPEEYINKLCGIFDEVKRVLKPEGTCWVNMGDTYSSQRWTGNGKGQPMNKMKDGHRDINPERITDLPAKCLVQIPSRFAIEMTNRGWILRNEIIWYKPVCMPQSCKDRFTVDFEKLFFFTKNTKYYFETAYEPLARATTDRLKAGKWNSRQDSKINQGVLPMSADSFNLAIENMREAGKRIKRCVWKIPPRPFKQSHFATYPEALIETPIRSGCPAGGIVYDPFMGAGTTAVVAVKQGKQYLGSELNPEYVKIAEERIASVTQPTTPIKKKTRQCNICENKPLIDCSGMNKKMSQM